MKAKNCPHGFLGTVLLFALLVICSIGTAKAEVNVTINIGPPPIVVEAPPELVMIPQTEIYFVPGVSYDVFFYNGYWWSPRGDRWYRSSQYNGSWVIVNRNYVPSHIIKVPKNYRVVYQKVRPISYTQWKKQYKSNVSRGRKH
ncbi:MAG: hypothetical protein WC890_02765 [Candidatus Margulisiibacteriota bacterium]